MAEPTGFLREILSDGAIPPAKLRFFRARLVDRLYGLVAAELNQQGVGKDKESVAKLGRRIGIDPFEMERLLRDPSAWDLVIASDLAIAVLHAEIGVKALPLTEE